MCICECSGLCGSGRLEGTYTRQLIWSQYMRVVGEKGRELTTSVRTLATVARAMILSNKYFNILLLKSYH